MAEQKWFNLKDAAPLLGFSSPRALREWSNKGLQEGWIRTGIHVKPRTPGRVKSPRLFHVDNCDRIGTKSRT
jgi:hypothetical protein